MKMGRSQRLHLKKLLMTPDVKRRAVQHLMDAQELSERRAFKLAELDRSTFQYEKQTGDAPSTEWN
ncbi:MAG: hypothetical protein ACO33A_01000 [Hyphomonas sp.]